MNDDSSLSKVAKSNLTRQRYCYACTSFKGQNFSKQNNFSLRIFASRTDYVRFKRTVRLPRLTNLMVIVHYAQTCSAINTTS